MLRYRLNELTWQQFELLSQSLLQQQFGIAIELWGGSGDGGRDAYCQFDLSLVEGVVSKGPFLFQVKHVTAKDAEAGLRNAVNSECTEIKRRIAEGTWHTLTHYVLITNVEVNGDLKKAVEDILTKRLPGVMVVSRWGGDVCALLDKHPQVRLRFPQILTVADLDLLFGTIVTDAMYADTILRSRSLLNKAKELRKVFEPTQTYHDALDKLREHNLVVLTGAPEMGKTAIAQMIAWSLSEAGWKTVSCSRPREFFALRNSISEPTVFVADDAFGTTEYEPGKALPWVENLGEIIPLLDEHHWLIWTARTTPFKLALRRLHLDYSHRKFPSPADVEVNAATLTMKEKAYIFFQHCRHASFDEPAKNVIRSYAETVVTDDKFTPERIRRFVTEQLTAELPKIVAGSFGRDDIMRLIRDGIDCATEGMVTSFQRLEEELQRILISMLDAGTATVAQSDLQQACMRLFGRNDLLNNIADLEGHFLQRANKDTQGNHVYEWIHPSWRDVVIDWVAAWDQLRENFLSRCGVTGVALALSEGGGAKGERNLPFLRTNRDWTHLTEHIAQVVIDASENQQKVLYDTLIEIAERANNGVHSAHIKELGSLILRALRSLRERWDREGQPIPVRLLSSYYRLSELVAEVEPSPNLRPTWSALETWISEFCNADFIQEFNTTAIEDALWLIEVLIENEPRFLRVVDFPDGCSPALKGLLKLLGEYDYDGIDRNRETYRGEENYIDELQSIVSRVEKVVPALKPERDQASKKLADKVAELKSDIEGMDENESPLPNQASPKTNQKKPVKDESFSIKELFAIL